MTPPLVRSVPCDVPVRVRKPKRAHVVGEIVRDVAVIAAAIFACSFLHLPSHRARCCFGCGESLADITHLTVLKYTEEAYPQWARQHPDQTCPASLEVLNEFMDRRDIKDPYGSPYVMTCTPKGIVVVSPGEDAILGTADDVRSDDR